MSRSTAIKARIIAALKQNFLPGLALQCFAGLIVFTYFCVPQSAPIFNWMSTQKQHYGYAYSFVATALFGGLIPFLFFWLSGRIDAAQSVMKLLLFYLIFWGYKGMEVDFFYRLQGEWFGYNNDLTTLALKVACDQFFYSVFWAAPSIAVIYLWKDSNWSFHQAFARMDKTFLAEEIPAMIFSNWLVWLPAVSLIYSLPEQLQIPLFNIVLCFWVLLLAVLTRKRVS